MIKEHEYYEEKMIESAEAAIDTEDVHKARLKQLRNIFKFGYGRKPADFNLLLKVMGDTEKLRKLMNDFIAVYRYYTYIGNGEKLETYLKESGIELANLSKWEPVDEEKAKKGKFDSACGDDFEANVGPELLKRLLDIGLDNLTSIDVLKEDITVNSELVEMRCDVSKPIFKKTVALKAMKLSGKDVSEKIKKIESASDQFSQVSEMI